MKNTKKCRFALSIKVVVAFVAALTISGKAHAYLDPGTGSLLIQGIIGAVAAIGVTLKLYWHKVRVMFGGGEEKAKKQAMKEKKEQKNTDQ